MTVALKEAGYGCIEQAKKTAEMFEKNWAAFAEEIRRRNEEAGGKKILFSSINEEALKYFKDKLAENIEKEEDHEKKRIMEVIQVKTMNGYIDLFNLFGDAYDGLVNATDLAFKETYCQDSLEIFSYDSMSNLPDVITLYAEGLAKEGRIDEMNEWFRQQIVRCSKDDLENVLERYDFIQEAFEDEGFTEEKKIGEELKAIWKAARVKA